MKYLKPQKHPLLQKIFECSHVFITFEKTLFLLLILHKLLNKSKITALSLPLTLAILCQAGVNSQIFGVVTVS